MRTGPPSSPKTTHTNTYIKHALCFPAFRHKPNIYTHTHSNKTLIWEEEPCKGWMVLNMINSIWLNPVYVSTYTVFLYLHKDFRHMPKLPKTSFSGKRSHHCDLRFNVTYSEHPADIDLSASCHVSHFTHFHINKHNPVLKTPHLYAEKCNVANTNLWNTAVDNIQKNLDC